MQAKVRTLHRISEVWADRCLQAFMLSGSGKVHSAHSRANSSSLFRRKSNAHSDSTSSMGGGGATHCTVQTARCGPNKAQLHMLLGT